MAITPYLAMTAAEIGGISPPPPKIAWMACHFSPYSTGISNLPDSLPEGSMLILNDITPIHGHDPQRIARQLSECMEKNRCMGLLLDFQRPGSEEMARYLSQALPWPVACQDNETGPVFLPPAPCNMPLAQYVKPWLSREIWLEAALSAQQLQLTQNGCEEKAVVLSDIPSQGLKDENLHCHYRIEISDDAACFTLWRTREDLAQLLDEADNLGIHTAVGLWQELG